MSPLTLGAGDELSAVVRWIEQEIGRELTADEFPELRGIFQRGARAVIEAFDPALTRFLK